MSDPKNNLGNAGDTLIDIAENIDAIIEYGQAVEDGTASYSDSESLMRESTSNLLDGLTDLFPSPYDLDDLIIDNAIDAIINLIEIIDKPHTPQEFQNEIDFIRSAVDTT
jgi:hypothetical protein